MSDRSESLRAFDRIASAEFMADVCGVDEVGRGCLAGPVVAAAVVLPRECLLPGLDDSKRLSAPARETQAEAVRACATAIGVSFVGPRRIEQTDIRRASLLAMYRAVGRAGCGDLSFVVLVDGCDAIPQLGGPQRSIVAGDSRSLAIAAASVIAKTVRDRFMRRVASRFPQYGFERHVGYPTPEHLAALAHHGPCPWHRRTFAPIARLVLGLEAASGAR